MALNAIVKDLNEVPEAFKGEYTEKDGKFYLQVAAVDGYALEDIAGLASALHKERTEKAAAESAYKPFKDFKVDDVTAALAAVGQYGEITPEQAKTAVAEVARLTAIDPEKEAGKLAEAQVSAAKREMESVFGTEKTVLTDKVTGLETANTGLIEQLKALTVGNNIKTSIAKHKVVEGLEDAVEMFIERSVKTAVKDGRVEFYVVGPDGQPRMKLEGTSLVPFTIDDLFVETKQTKPGFFQPDQVGGAGMQPGRPAAGNGGQKNPWTSEHWNQTEQAKIRLANPALAATMKAQAGK